MGTGVLHHCKPSLESPRKEYQVDMNLRSLFIDPQSKNASYVVVAHWSLREILVISDDLRHYAQLDQSRSRKQKNSATCISLIDGDTTASEGQLPNTAPLNSSADFTTTLSIWRIGVA